MGSLLGDTWNGSSFGLSGALISSNLGLSLSASEAEEIWSDRPPKKGDHIRVIRMLYSHHGIYISDNEVIHFTGQEEDSILDWSKCEVISTSIERFRKDGTVEVKIYTPEEQQDLYPVEHIVQYARSCLGDKGYTLIFNNCEHFANVCTLGRFRSRQVERVFSGQLPVKENKKMGFFGKLFGGVGRFIGGLFKGNRGSEGGGGGGDRSVSNTTYEPDKVRIAEIELETKTRLAGMENERIELMKRAKIELLQFQTDCEIALEEARAKGFVTKVQAIIAIQSAMNEIAEKRFQIIEKASLAVIREIETFYDSLGEKIIQDNDKYLEEKLPRLLTALEKFEPGTAAYDMYRDQIDKDRDRQIRYVEDQISAVKHRQTLVIESHLEGKARIEEQTGQIINGMIEVAKRQALQSGVNPELVEEAPAALGTGVSGVLPESTDSTSSP